jgi:hypothetical protein
MEARDVEVSAFSPPASAGSSEPMLRKLCLQIGGLKVVGKPKHRRRGHRHGGGVGWFEHTERKFTNSGSFGVKNVGFWEFRYVDVGWGLNFARWEVVQMCPSDIFWSLLSTCQSAEPLSTWATQCGNVDGHQDPKTHVLHVIWNPRLVVSICSRWKLQGVHECQSDESEGEVSELSALWAAKGPFLVVQSISIKRSFWDDGLLRQVDFWIFGPCML